MSPPHRHAGHCILAPEILRNIARNGTAAQRERALATLGVDLTFRTMRAQALFAPRPLPSRLTTPLRPHRSIYDGGGTTTLPGKPARSEGARKTGDVAVTEAYDGLGATFALYAEAYDRNSNADAGLELKATVHHGQDYDNAFWNGEQMVFGDGDGELFNRFTVSLDVIGHELTHGVTEIEAQLQYLGQSGALNESVSDVFGSLVKQKALGQTAAEADWLIGEGLFTKKVKGQALRSLSEPGSAFDDPVLGKDPQPGHMGDYVHTTSDNGGVHTNSGIPNRAFCLAAVGIGGQACEQAGLVWYDTVRDPSLRSNATFAQFAALTVNTAGKRYGRTSAEAGAVSDAWSEVGVLS